MAFLGIPTSRKELQSNSFIKGAVGTAVNAAGNIAGALGNKGVQKSAANINRNIWDPNIHYTGSLNPIEVATGAAPASWNQLKTTAAPKQQQTFQDPSQGQGGLYAGGSAYDPDTDPAKIAAKRQQVRGLMDAFEKAYNEVLGKVDTLAAQKRADLETNYNTQQVGLDKNFGSTTTGIDDQFSARNAYHSSYRENAQQQAKDAYDGATGNLRTAKEKDLAGVGQFVDQQRAEFDTSRPRYNVDDYGTASELTDIGQNVDAAVNKIRATGAGLGTDSQYIQRLNSIAPQQETGSAALRAQLDKLVQTGTNPEAKRAIAAVTIQNAGGDQSQWMDYFEKQQQQTGSDANQNIAIA